LGSDACRGTATGFGKPEGRVDCRGVADFGPSGSGVPLPEEGAGSIGRAGGGGGAGFLGG
jgi:hypothetical protein